MFHSPFILFIIFKFSLGQLSLIDLSYTINRNGPSNAGVIQAYLTRNPLAWTQDVSWYTICASSTTESRTKLSNDLCQKYGYTMGVIKEVNHNTVQIPCAQLTCTGQNSNLDQCPINVNYQWENSILYIICYRSNTFPLGQSPPESPRYKTSVNCDFEGDHMCGWELYMMKMVPAGFLFQLDSTLHTSTGHILTPNCIQSTWSSWGSIQQYPTIQAVAISPVLDHCLGYTQYCLSFATLAPMSPLRPPMLNVTVVDINGRDMWSSSGWSGTQTDWSLMQVQFKAWPPFRVKIRLTCTGDQSSMVYIDDISVSTGECPSTRNTYCYNNGQEEVSNQENRCHCPNEGTMGRMCELTACNSGKRIGNVGWVLLVNVILIIFIN